MPGIRIFCCGLACRNNNLADNRLYRGPPKIDWDWARSRRLVGVKITVRRALITAAGHSRAARATLGQFESARQPSKE